MTVFSPDSTPATPNELDSDTVADNHMSPIQMLHVSNLDSSTDESVDHTEPQ